MNYPVRCFILSLCLFVNVFSSVQVNTSLKISAGEKKYNSCRIPYAKNKTIEFLEQNLPEKKKGIFSKLRSNEFKMPRIDFCFSGGGARALLSPLGFMMGAQEIKLLDMATSIATLSGSVWLIAMWMLSRTDPKSYKNIIQPKLVNQNFYYFWNLDLDAIATKLILKYQETGRFDMADLWGAILCDRLMDNMQFPSGEIINKQYITMKDTCAQLELGGEFNNPYYPFPIYTSSITCVKPYEWLEINPYSVGSDYLGGYIPTQNFNSPFNYGYTQCPDREESIASFMGLCGSAYSSSLWDFIENECENLVQKLEEKGCPGLVTLVRNFMWWFYQNKDKADPARVFASHYCNFTYNMPNLPLSYSPNIELADAGFSYNLPFAPLLKRHSDIIVVCDASGNCPDLTFFELRCARDYAYAKGYTFPYIGEFDKDDKFIPGGVPIGDFGRVFESDDPQTPTIIYFQNIIKESTSKFNYTERESNEVCYSMNYMVANHKTDIANAIFKVFCKMNGINKKMSLKNKIFNKVSEIKNSANNVVDDLTDIFDRLSC